MCLDPLPTDHEQYYGFTQFAVELNELDSALRPLLPLTDSRFRPDQRSAHVLVLYKCKTVQRGCEEFRATTISVTIATDYGNLHLFFKYVVRIIWGPSVC